MDFAIRRYPVIAAVRDVNRMKDAIESRVEIIFLMAGDILSIEDCVAATKKHNKMIFLHIDLIKGIANDKEGLRYLAHRLKPDGIVSTKNQLIHAAKKEGLLAVHHLFLIDTQASETGIKNVLDTKPDMVEIMPGLMPRVIQQMSQAVKCPLVVAGLIKSREEIIQAIDAGAWAVAIGDPELWNLEL